MPKNIIDDAEVDATAAKLDNAVSSTLVPQLTSLQRDVEALLGNGLVLAQTSPRMLESYTSFNTSVTQAVNNITQFSKQFRDIVAAVNNLDGQIANGIPNS
ncbi:hypothetical protein [Streptomyces sp. SID13726]|uniref:hypothetical protein n=1 Tax=Streptomyces sp. SID13726 TaxID=2706058 RepID=UPI0013B85675|nr:hypothetical protein [Streptomyces sp. SID13726]NEA98863.1 hypothetical protein [Streptomyces sp. SID13726]